MNNDKPERSSSEAIREAAELAMKASFGGEKKQTLQESSRSSEKPDLRLLGEKEIPARYKDGFLVEQHDIVSTPTGDLAEIVGTGRNSVALDIPKEGVRLVEAQDFVGYTKLGNSKKPRG